MWFARFARTRPLAAGLIADGHVRLNGTRIEASAHMVRRGDVLTLSLARSVVVVKVTGFAARRQSAAQTVGLYELQGDASAVG